MLSSYPYHLLGAFLLFLLPLPFSSSNEQDYDMPTSITLFHSFSSDFEDDFSERGTISINTQNIIGGYHSTRNVKQSALEQSELQQLKNLARNNGLYRIKAIVKTANGRKTTLLTYVKACLLLESNLSDIITVFLNANYDVVSVSAATIKATCENNFEDIWTKNFNTTVNFRKTEPGPVPDTATFIQTLEREREAREKGGRKDNRSFFAKYWMYIVPAVIFVLLSGASAQEGPQQ
ncbi:unnamed protein product [Bemisia tabaci]|uniref:ER membrane protein complex subunit 10 n=1 Tax=Bemisia tabaci TaxID=7038 RepID=A0A9P0AIV8_BEMTA|nr:unnamed protein product [Bemisia tabaci]